MLLGNKSIRTREGCDVLMWGRRGGRVLSVTLSAGRPLAKGPERISFAPSRRAKEISIIWHSDADLHVLEAGVKGKAA